MSRMSFLDEPPPAAAERYKGFTWVFYYVGNSSPCLKFWIGKSKRPKCYRFPNSLQRQAYVDRMKAAEDRAEESRERREQERKKQAAEMREKLKVGAILHYSWGYEQTNCEFFEVVSISDTGATCIIREIAGETIPGSEGFMCERLRPCPGQFLKDSPPIRKRIGPHGIVMDHGIASICAPDSVHYSSWYA